jgi:hypothetical protein
VFQAWLFDHLNLDHAILATSNIYYWNLGELAGINAMKRRDVNISPATERARTFFELMLYGRSEDDRLLDLLLQVVGRTEQEVRDLDRPWKVAILIQKVPYDLGKWLDAELSLIRALGFRLELFLLMTADAWPAPWDRVTTYFEPPMLRSNILPAFRVRLLFVDPPVMSVITAGMGAMKQLKKMVILELCTGVKPMLAAAAGMGNEYLDWRPVNVPAFTASKRFLIDFTPGDLVSVVSAFSTLAVKTGGRRALQTSRSFGDSPQLKRRTLVISYSHDYDECSDTLWDAVVKVVQANTFQIIAGWEVLFHVPDTAYILDSTNLQWTMHPYIKEALSQCVLTSKSKAIIILAGKETSDSLITRAGVWNDAHPECQITCLRDHQGRVVWRGGAQGGGNIGPPRAHGCPAPAPEDFTMILDGNEEHRTPELGAQFLNSIRDILISKGYAPDTMATKTWPVRSRTGPGNRLLVTGWTFHPLRALVYTFNNYTWESDVGSPIVVKIQNSTIDQELGHNATLRLLSTRPAILAIAESTYIAQHGHAPPLALPGVP